MKMSISIERLKNVKRLVTHANCPDGVASALIVRDALPDVEVLFVKHGTEQHRELEPRPGTLFVDFSPHVEKDDLFQVVKHWVEAGTIVLDHHPTQRDVTMAFVEAGLGAYGENDRGECGAWLAYEHVWRALKGDHHFQIDGADFGLSVRNFAELAGVRDTWKKDDPRWYKACLQAEALMFWSFDHVDLDEFVESSEMTTLGGRLFEKKLEHARAAIAESHRFQTPRGTRVLLFQGVTPTSDAAELLEKDPYLDGRGDRHAPDIVAGFHYRVDAGKLQLTFSTRSHTGYDVGAFCKAHGGGGHTAAAGFTVSGEMSANPYTVFKLLLQEWESGQ
jgi:hypothetical protein